MKRRRTAFLGLVSILGTGLLVGLCVYFGRRRKLSNPPDPTQGGVVQFPEDYSVGIVLVRGPSDAAGARWLFLAEAKKKVTIPPGKVLKVQTGPTVRWKTPFWRKALRKVGFQIPTAGQPVPVPLDIRSLAPLFHHDVRSLKIQGTSVSRRNWRRIRQFTRLQELDVSGCAITDKDLRRIRRLTSLVSLNLWNTAISDAGLVHLEKLPSLQSLVLPYHIGEKGFDHLSRLASLRDLDLTFNANVAGEGLARFRDMTSLRRLVLSSSRVDDTALAQLSGLESLEELHLAQTNISDAALAHLRAVPSLRTLVLTDTGITREGLRHLQRLKSLRSLDLGYLEILEEDLALMREMTWLRHLRISGERLSDRAIRDLNDAMRWCEVTK